MKRLLSTTTALALAITPVAPLPVSAQTMAEDGSVIGEDGTVLCTPTAEAPCDLKAIKKELKKAEAKAKKAEEKAAAEAAAAQAAADQQAAEEAAAAQAAAEQKAAEEAAAAQAAAEQKAAEEAAAEAAAEQKAAEEAAAAQAAADQKAAEEAAAAQAAADQKAAEEAAAAQAAAEQQAAEAAAAEQKAAEEAAAAAQQAAEQPAQGGTAEPAPGMLPEQTPGQTPDQPTGPSVSQNGQPNVEAPGEGAAPTLPQAGTSTEENVAQQPAEDPPVPVAEQTIDPTAVTTPPSAEEVQVLTDLLAQPQDGSTETAPAAAATEAAQSGSTASTGSTVTETTLTEEDTRSSTEDFATTASGKKKKDKDGGLSDFEKAGLVALGALAVGVMLSNRDQVVSNTGDRVVVQRSDGNYAVYKDDDALLRQPGSTVKTETFNDGSTRTTVTRDDGTTVVTIRDATGRVLKRSAYDTKGREIVLIDDLAPEKPVVVSTLPKPTAPVISTQGGDPELAAALAAIQARDIGRTFSLRQIRDIKEVRALAATVDVDNITFDTGSAAITTAQAENLAALGAFLKKMLARNPGEIFLVEGHTDAVGSAASNLALSDRRAESVALALTEYFGVPPENLVVQGYGESDLRIQTDGDERLNRRVAVRVITPLLTVASN